jgi:hypothetical protein
MYGLLQMLGSVPHRGNTLCLVAKGHVWAGCGKQGGQMTGYLKLESVYGFNYGQAQNTGGK